MITARQFKAGFIIEINRKLHLILESQHIKPGKGGAFVRAKLKNLANGSIFERTFRPEETFPQIYIEEKKMQFLYKDDAGYHFMDFVTYEQIGVEKDLIGQKAEYLREGMEVTASMHEGKLIDISLPSIIELKVAYTEPWVKGDTAKAGTKPATLETGAVCKVPLFINAGDVIKIDTRTGSYVGRA